MRQVFGAAACGAAGWLTAGVVTLAAMAGAALAGDFPTIGKFDRHDPRFDALVPKDAVIEKLAAGYRWSEGPVWVPKDGCLLFSDIPNNRIVRFRPGKGTDDFLKPAGYSGSKPRGGEPGTNGLALDAEGRLVLCEHGDRRIARLNPDGTKTTLADRFEGMRFNSPNDLAFDKAGNLFFTDPPYGLEKGADDPAREMDYCGVFRLAKDGKVTLLTRALSRPNGVGLSPDEKTLYVAVSDPANPVWMAYDLSAEGAVSNGRVFFDSRPWAAKGLPGLPDGLKVDVAGNLWATGPGGVFVISPKGEYLGRIDTGVPTANCGFGDDGKTLYVTANNWLVRVRTNAKGKGF